MRDQLIILFCGAAVTLSGVAVAVFIDAWLRWRRHDKKLQEVTLATLRRIAERERNNDGS